MANVLMEALDSQYSWPATPQQKYYDGWQQKINPQLSDEDNAFVDSL
jgi:hypothetical protein